MSREQILFETRKQGYSSVKEAVIANWDRVDFEDKKILELTGFNIEEEKKVFQATK